MIERIKPYAQTILTTLCVLTDALLTLSAFYAAYALRRRLPWPHPAEQLGPFGEYAGLMLMQMVWVCSIAWFYRLYQSERARPWIDELSAIAGAISISTLISIAGASFFLKNTLFELDYSRSMLVYAWLLNMLLVGLGRLVHRRLRVWLYRRSWCEMRVLVVGSGEVVQMIVQKLVASLHLGYRLIGVVNGSPGRRIQGIPVLGTVDQLSDLIQEHQIGEVIIGEPEASHAELLRIVALCERGGRVNIKIFPDLFQIMASQITIGDLDGLPLLTVRDVALRGWKLSFKRAMDVIGSTVGLIFLSPFFMFIALLIKLDSPGPVLYTQERMGLDGKLFWMTKFRSMRVDAENCGPGWTTEDDPRRTKLGEMLRRTNIDELPQLINVFLGEMSLVGPRPERPMYVEQFRRSIPRYMERHREKGGMTGWAQVNGLRGDTSIPERIKYDLWYIENWSLWLDIKIVMRTVFSLGGKNAY